MAIKEHKITMLGTGLIGMFYTMALHNQRGRDRVHMIYSRNEEKAKQFAKDWDIPRWTTNMSEAIYDSETDVVVIGIPNYLHKEAVLTAAKAGKAILCTKPLARNAAEAKEMLDIVEKAGVFAGYLEDLIYPPKTLKSLESVRSGAIGKVNWCRSRETHSGPHSDWFWDNEKAGGGAIIDLGCHCIEISRNFIGKNIRPVEVMCWADTLVHPIDAEDHGVGLVRYENRSVGQFEVSWGFQGGMDLRDEVSGSEGTIWLNHFMRTGFEMFTTGAKGGYVSEKSGSDVGWLFPVGDEAHEMGYVNMFQDMFNAIDENREPIETFYDGYIVNAIMDACYNSVKSKKWEPVNLAVWRGETQTKEKNDVDKLIDGQYFLIKEERMPDGQIKLILKDKNSGKITQKYITEE